LPSGAAGTLVLGMDIRVFAFPGHPDIPQAEVVEVADVQGVAFYCSDEAEAELRRRLRPSRKPVVNFLGSGDYHYMSKILTDSISVPFSLLLLDNHPDMQRPAFGDILSCGGWLRSMLEGNASLRKVAIVGVDPALVGECEGFPGRVSILARGEKFSEGWLDYALGEGGIYVSIDKDVMGKEYAVTDWSQGDMDIDTMERILRFAAKGRDILGVDICGALPAEKGATAGDIVVNKSSDERILKAVLSLNL